MTATLTALECDATMAAYRAAWFEAGIEYGLCLCGCGGRTGLAPQTSQGRGRFLQIKGEPHRYIHGHSGRPPQQGQWSRAEIVAAMRRWAEIHGGPPTSAQWQSAKADVHPTRTTVKRYFGTWRAALVEAGFKPKRARGSGHLDVVRLKDGREVWRGAWTTTAGRRRARKIGVKTGPNCLSRLAAEEKLAKVIARDNERLANGREPAPVPASADKAYAHLRRALREADRVEGTERGIERVSVQQALHHMHEAEDWLMRAMGRC